MVRIPMRPDMRPLHPRSDAMQSAKGKKKKGMWGGGKTDLLRSSGTEHDGTFRADEYFVLDAQTETVKVLGELRVSRDIHAYI